MSLWGAFFGFRMISGSELQTCGAFWQSLLPNYTTIHHNNNMGDECRAPAADVPYSVDINKKERKHGQTTTNKIHTRGSISKQTLAGNMLELSTPGGTRQLHVESQVVMGVP